VYASIITIQADVLNQGDVNVNQSLNPAKSTDVLSSGQSMVTSLGTGGYFVRSGFGNMGMSFFVTDDCPSILQCFQVGGGGKVTAISSDVIFVGGASTSDFLSLNLVVDGSVNASGNPAISGGATQASADYLLQTFGVTRYEASAACGVLPPSPTCASGTAVNTRVLLPLGFFDGTLVDTGLFQELFAQFGCVASPGSPCSVSGDFAHTAKVGGATIVDTNGNPVLGTTITSSSGYDYTQSLDPSTVPEPPSFGFVLLGLAAGALMHLRHSMRFDRN
jgi:hypothetical protein